MERSDEILMAGGGLLGSMHCATSSDQLLGIVLAYVESFAMLSEIVRAGEELPTLWTIRA